MVVSIRVSPKQEELYRQYAEERGMTISEFMRKCADDVVAQAQAIIDEATEQDEHAKRLADFEHCFTAFVKLRDATPLMDCSEEEIHQARLASYGLA